VSAFLSLEAVEQVLALACLSDENLDVEPLKAATCETYRSLSSSCKNHVFLTGADDPIRKLSGAECIPWVVSTVDSMLVSCVHQVIDPGNAFKWSIICAAADSSRIG